MADIVDDFIAQLGMTGKYTRAEVLASLRSDRDKRFAALVTECLCLAAETHPDDLRAALANVLPDFGRMQEISVRIANAVAEGQAKMSELAARARKSEEWMKAMEDRLSAAEFEREQGMRPTLAMGGRNGAHKTG